MRALFLACIISAPLFSFTAGAGAPIVVHAEGSDECRPDDNGPPSVVWDYPVCGIYARANWTVEACDPTSCTVRLETHSNAWAFYPGFLHVETFAVPGWGGYACVGPKAVSDKLRDELPCGRVCQTLAVGWTASCMGSLTATIRVEPGYCNAFHVAEAFWVDGGAMGGGNVFWWAYVCQRADGTPFLDVR